jgi:hypothetical protein
LIRCTLAENSADYGGALHAGLGGDRSIGTVWENCLVYGNSATSYAIHTGVGTMANTYRIDMRHTTVADNSGGGIYGKVNAYNPHGSMRIRNSMIVNNGPYGINYDNSGQAVAAPVFEYNDVYGHSAADYFDDAVPGAGRSRKPPRSRMRDPGTTAWCGGARGSTTVPISV